MAFDQRSLDDYVDVAERITQFYDRYPDGSLQAADPLHPWDQAVVTGVAKDGKEFTATLIVYTAAAYRTPDDRRPGIGVAWEVFPGRTPYTLGSELMNAETSAWGRALAALGIATKQGVASRQEVRLARERSDGLPVNRDGSLSRSRTTDAEKDAAGVMTSGQLAEHTGLRAKRADQKAPAVRLAAVPADDPWYDPGPADERTFDSAGTITRDQQRAMHAAFGVLGVTDREVRLKVSREALGLDVLASSSDLSRLQAGQLLEALHAQAKAERS